MRFLKWRLGTVMTCETKGGFDFNKKVLFIRAVGKVTGRAAFRLFDLVNNLLLEIFLLVTLKAGLVTLGFKQATCLGGMGIMAYSAFGSLESRVNILLIEANLLFSVAGITDLAPFLL